MEIQKTRENENKKGHQNFYANKKLSKPVYSEKNDGEKKGNINHVPNSKKASYLKKLSFQAPIILSNQLKTKTVFSVKPVGQLK